MPKGRVRGVDTVVFATYLPHLLVCTNFEVEPQLQPLDNELFNLRGAVTSPEARLHLKAASGLLVSWSYSIF